MSSSFEEFDFEDMDACFTAFDKDWYILYWFQLLEFGFMFVGVLKVNIFLVFNV